MLIACFVTVHMCISFFFHQFVTYGHFLVGYHCSHSDVSHTKYLCYPFAVDGWQLFGDLNTTLNFSIFVWLCTCLVSGSGVVRAYKIHFIIRTMEK